MVQGLGFRVTVWFLVGNGGMDYGDYCWGLYRDYYYRDPFPPFPAKHQTVKRYYSYSKEPPKIL